MRFSSPPAAFPLQSYRDSHSGRSSPPILCPPTPIAGASSPPPFLLRARLASPPLAHLNSRPARGGCPSQPPPGVAGHAGGTTSRWQRPRWLASAATEASRHGHARPTCCELALLRLDTPLTVDRHPPGDDFVLTMRAATRGHTYTHQRELSTADRWLARCTSSPHCFSSLLPAPPTS